MASTADEPICRGLTEAIALSAYFAPIGDLLWPLHRYKIEDTPTLASASAR